MNNLEDIWDTEFNYVFVGKPHNYIKRLKIKQEYLAANIRYLNRVIANPEYTTAMKEEIFIPSLKRMLRTRKSYEKQGSLLAV